MAKTVNIEDFFTEENEKQGLWFCPKIDGELFPLEFLVTGTGTDENIAGSERFEKAFLELQNITDPIEKADKQKVLDANRVAEFIKGVRPRDGLEVKFGGKAVEYSEPFIQQLLLKSPLVKVEIINFAKRTENFIKREKND